MNKVAAVLAIVVVFGVVFGWSFFKPPDQRSKNGHRILDFIANVDQAIVECEIEYRPERKIWGDRFENTDDSFLYLSALPNLRLTFQAVEILPDARLHYGFGANKMLVEPPQGEVEFSIILESPSQGQRTLLQRALTAVEARDPQIADSLDLAAFAGETVNLAFVTKADSAETNVWPAWFDLRLVSSGRAHSEQEQTRSLRSVALRFVETLDEAEIEAQNADLPLTPSRPRQSGTGGFVVGPGPVLAASPPSQVRYRVQVEPDSILETWTALAATATPEQQGPVRFKIGVNGTELWSRICRTSPEDKQGGREFATVDLAEFAGQEVEITFHTESVGNEPPNPIPAGWIYPQIIRNQTIPRQKHSASAPSVLMIVVDTLRSDRLGCYGAERRASPNLDAFAKNAIVCERVIAQSSWTLPSTATLLTGLYPLSHGVLNERRTFLDDSLESLPEIFSEEGFTTAAFVSNLLLSTESNFHQGFETYQRLSWANAKKINKRFLNWLDNNEEFRFFAYLHYVDPHDPYHAPGPFHEVIQEPGNSFAGLTDTETFTALAGKLPDQPLASLENPIIAEGMQHLLDLYDSEIYYWDHCFGQLLEALRSRGRLDSTLIVVTSDHGEEFLEHGRLFHAQQLYEESIRVPLVMKIPGRGGERITDLVEGVDLFPSLLGQLGYERNTHGRDFLSQEPRPVFTSTELGTVDGVEAKVIKNAVIANDWKLISVPATDQTELFHLGRDPQETQDLAQSEAKVVQSMRTLLENWIMSTIREDIGGILNADPEAIEHMRELGYIDR